MAIITEKNPAEVRRPAVVRIDAEKCKGCELCVYYCPQETLEMSGKISGRGFDYAEVVLDNCTGCQECARVCPDHCIEIWRNPVER
jgi:2-oxoglutarate ferredoxin oxidoreductase subunit delta